MLITITLLFHAYYMFDTTQEYKKDLEQSIIDSNVVSLFENLLTIAVEEWASDIHIEPLENYCRIRIRIDWTLFELVQYPKTLHENLISKFKIESGQMRPDEKRLPQDARVSNVTRTNKEIDLRANTLPNVWGEKLVMRIVDKSKSIPLLKDLGIEWRNMDLIAKNIHYPNGIILNTWPTGSGKTTTLYACLDSVNTTDVNAMTFEDPVENKMSWLNQSQVRADIWFTFASGLRAALRQDPDIIMVWEIRDKETLDMAMESAMTWHLVFSTIHTNSATETITRMFNMGAQPYMLAGTFNLVIAQRLLKRVCPQCKKEHSVKWDPLWEYSKWAFSNFEPEMLKKEILSRGIDQNQWTKFMKDGIITVWTGKDANGESCPMCMGTGYKWRIGVYELMDYDDELKHMLMEWKSTLEIQSYALKNGMIDLERDWILKVIKWYTDLKEVYRFVKTKNKRVTF